MSVELVAHWAPKAHRPDREWEDSAALSERCGCFAVADGASSSPRAGPWARCLTREFVRAPFSSTAELPDWLDRCRAELDERSRSVPSDPWFAEAVTARAAFATFLGVELLDGERSEYRAVAVGDTCLFHVRGDDLVRAWPIASPSTFGTTPDLVSSDPEHASLVMATAVTTADGLLAGDMLLVATDALAAWILMVCPREPDIWPLLATVDAATFAHLVTDLRGTGEIADDDVTLVRGVIA